MILLLERLFWFSGRVGRRSYLLVGLCLLAVIIGYFCLLFHIATEFQNDEIKGQEALNAAYRYLWWLAQFLCLWSSAANNAKRLHDFGWSGWWQIGPFALIYGLSHATILPSIVYIGIFVIGGLASLTLCGMLLFRGGSESENRFGPQPDSAALRGESRNAVRYAT